MQTHTDAQMHMMINALHNEIRVQKAVINGIKDINLDDLTPRGALEVLWKIKENLK